MSSQQSRHNPNAGVDAPVWYNYIRGIYDNQDLSVFGTEENLTSSIFLSCVQKKLVLRANILCLSTKIVSASRKQLDEGILFLLTIMYLIHIQFLNILLCSFYLLRQVFYWLKRKLPAMFEIGSYFPPGHLVCF